MNMKRKVILVIYGLAFVFLSAVYVPLMWVLSDSTGYMQHTHGPIWNLPEPFGVDFVAWLLEILALSVVFAVLFILTGNQRKGIP